MTTSLLRAACAALLLSATLPGCEPPEDVEPLPCRNPEAGVAELGVGDLDSGYLELADGDDVSIIFGPQGMHMVTVSARVLDLEPAQAGGVGNRVSVAVRHEGVVVGGVVSDMQPSLLDGDAADFLGIRSVFTVAEIDQLDGEPAEVEVIVRDGCGRELAARRQVRLKLFQN